MALGIRGFRALIPEFPIVSGALVDLSPNIPWAREPKSSQSSLEGSFILYVFSYFEHVASLKNS